MANNNKQSVVVVENKLSKLLASSAVKQLATDLKLTKKQIMSANTAALELQGDPKLKECSQYSIVQYCYYTARYNFVHPNAVYPVPYDGKIQFQLGYLGLKELVMRTGKYRMVNAVPVLDCDQLYRDDWGQYMVKFEHDPKKAEGAKTIGYLAFAIYKDGTTAGTEYWSNEQVEKHAYKYSKAYKSFKNGKSNFTSPWCDPMQFPKMAMKTALKSLCKNLDMSPLVEDAIKEDQIVYGNVGQPNTYADNPNNIETYDFSNEGAKSTTTNSILPPTEAVEEPEEEPAKEEPKKEAAPKPAPKKEAVPAKTENTEQDDDFYDRFDEIIGA